MPRWLGFCRYLNLDVGRNHLSTYPWEVICSCWTLQKILRFWVGSFRFQHDIIIILTNYVLCVSYDDHGRHRVLPSWQFRFYNDRGHCPCQCRILRLFYIIRIMNYYVPNVERTTMSYEQNLKTKQVHLTRKLARIHDGQLSRCENPANKWGTTLRKWVAPSILRVPTYLGVITAEGSSYEETRARVVWLQLQGWQWYSCCTVLNSIGSITEVLLACIRKYIRFISKSISILLVYISYWIDVLNKAYSRVDKWQMIKRTMNESMPV